MKPVNPISIRDSSSSSSFVCALTLATTGVWLCLAPLAQAQLPNAWQVDDHTNTATLSYNAMLSDSAQQAATNGGFDFSVNARFVTDYGQGNQTMVMIYGDGATRWEILWSLNGSGDLVAELYGDGNRTFTVTTNGTGAVLYHTYQISYNPTSHMAGFSVDGLVLTTNWAGSALAWTGGEVAWGGGSSAGVGAMNFHTVSFVVTNSEVAGYNAGTEPSNAPDPIGGGWVLSSSPPPAGISTNAISPDPVPLPAIPVATTLNGASPDPHEATLSGAVNQGNLAATVWFDWGTDTNYGNITPPQPLLSDTNEFDLSQTLTGLAKGTTYHFRCVATNVQGIARGADGVFITPLSFVVTTLADSGAGSLRQAIADAQSGDTIAFATNGTITLTNGELLVTNDLTVAGPASADLTVSGNNASRVFHVGSGASVGIEGLIIRDGHALNGASSNIKGVPGGNGAAGGGIYNAGTLMLSNCVVTSNSSGNGGTGNTPSTGGGSNGGEGGNGGGIYSIGTLTLYSCIVSSNSCGRGGIGGNGAPGINVSTPDGGAAGAGGSGGSGGGIYSDAVLSLTACTVSDNSTGAGAVGGNGGDAVNLSGGSGGPGGGGGAGGAGGGLYSYYNAGTFTLTGCQVNANIAGHGAAGGTGGAGGVLGGSPGANGAHGSAGDDGGICNYYSIGEPSITGCTLSDNSGAHGGGIEDPGDTSTSLIINNSTLAGNHADWGGGIDSDASGLVITNSTLSGNSATYYGGGISCDTQYTYVKLVNTIIAGNTDPTPTPNISGKTYGGPNLTGNNPLLAPLGEYGGPVPTMPPLPGSPAIDTGDDSATNSLATDQRGYPRLSGGHIDKGAVEVQVVPADNPPLLMNPMMQADGALGFDFMSIPGAEFDVLASTNVTLPFAQWSSLGTILAPAAANSPGRYQFRDSSATNYPQRFYQVVSP